MIDLVVVGGGQAGLAAGAAAAARGLRVVVCEKSRPLRRLGVFLRGDPVDRAGRRDACARCCPTATRSSGGCWWRASSPPWPPRATRACRSPSAGRSTRLRRRLPHGHPRAARALGVARSSDLRLNTPVRSLLVDDGRRVRRRSRAGRRSARAPCCSPPAASRVTGSWSSASSAGTPTARSCAPTAAASGDGFRLAASAGAAASSGLGDVLRAHGRLAAVARSSPRSYLPLAQYHSKWCILVNRLGRRYHDEALGRRGRQPADAAPAGRARRAAVRRVGAPRARGQRAVPARAGHRPLRARRARWARGSRRRRRSRSWSREVAEWGVDAAALARHARALRARRRAGRADHARRCRCARRRSGRSSSSRRSRSPSAACASTAWGRVLDRDGAVIERAVLRRRRRGRAPGPALCRGADAGDGVRPAGRGGSGDGQGGDRCLRSPTS